jgi:hypothetical protein
VTTVKERAARLGANFHIPISTFARWQIGGRLGPTITIGS